MGQEGIPALRNSSSEVDLDFDFYHP